MSERPKKEEPKQPLEDPELGPNGPRTPYPQSDDSQRPSSQPDYSPGKPATNLPDL
jgi:hypothetical protein